MSIARHIAALLFGIALASLGCKKENPEPEAGFSEPFYIGFNFENSEQRFESSSPDIALKSDGAGRSCFNNFGVGGGSEEPIISIGILTDQQDR